MMTIEATKDKKVVATLRLTDPYDGASREENEVKAEKWKNDLVSIHGDVELVAYFD
jgi:hypothetical protein